MSKATEPRANDPRRSDEQLHLNYFHFPTGAHEAAWRHPGADSVGSMTLDYLISLAETVEAACFDSIFIPGNQGMLGIGETDYALNLEPLLALTAIGARTKRLGLIGTASTTFSQPWALAKSYATLDHLSGGRAGWNVITSSTDFEAQNFSMEKIPDHEERYGRAAEFVEVVLKLWDAWQDDWAVIDKERGIFADTDKVQDIEHVGTRYSVRGALCVPPSPQRRPLLVQAGASETGRQFAARYAEAIFTYGATLADGQAVYADLKERAEQFGRSPDEIKIIPGLAPIIGATEAEAQRTQEELADLLAPERGMGMLQAWLHVDFSGHSPDEPVPPLPDPSEFAGSAARMQLVHDFVARENPTLRQLASFLAVGGGTRVIAGTAEQVADSMEEWFREGAADGFNIMAPVIPGGLEQIVRELVPILQERGLFRTEYTGKTLRDHYGLPLRSVDRAAAADAV